MVKRHIVKLIFRVMLLAAAIVLFLTAPEMLEGGPFIWIVWATLAGGMIWRIIPNNHTAMGARKHFARCYKPSGTAETPKVSHKGAFLSGFGWFIITLAVLLTLKITNNLSPATALILALIYAIVDIAFILFYCPFRTLFMKNHCCTTCRIYNWDYFMMTAPLAIFPSFFSLSLIFLSIIVLLRWEISIRKNPHFFTRITNKNLHCHNCTDKLCKLNFKK